jgi:hypothetical protein
MKWLSRLVQQQQLLRSLRQLFLAGRRGECYRFPGCRHSIRKSPRTRVSGGKLCRNKEQ